MTITILLELYHTENMATCAHVCCSLEDLMAVATELTAKMIKVHRDWLKFR